MTTEEIKISLAAARVNAGYTQEQVAETMGISRKTLINWEKGASKPSLADVKFMSDMYNIPIDCIFLPDKAT